MKITKLIYTGLISFFLLFSCSPEDIPNKTDIDNPKEINTEQLNKLQELSNESYTIELLSENQILKVGYNPVFVKIKESKTNEYITAENIAWKVTLNGLTCCKKHTEKVAPTLGLNAVKNNKTLLEGALILEKATDEDNNISTVLEVKFNHNGEVISIVDKIVVNLESEKNKSIQCFEGEDNKKYTIALMEPSSPKIGVNDIKVVLFNEEGEIADGYKVLITPYMPGMGHGSPNNEDLTQSKTDKFYHGKVNFTMDGYWKIHLQLVDKDGKTIKGGEVEDKADHSGHHNAHHKTHHNNDEKAPNSSLFFEIQFKK